jgi:PAS domain S-box-containing protein
MKSVGSQAGSVVEEGFSYTLGEQSRLKFEKVELQGVLEALAIPVVIFSVSDGRILRGNQALGRLLDQPLERLQQQSLSPDYLQPETLSVLLENMEQAGVLSNYRMEGANPSGKEFVVQASLSPVLFDGLQAILATLQDITQEEQTQRELKKELELRSLASEEGNLHFWRWSPQGDEALWETAQYDLFELVPGTPVTLEVFLQRVHPKDQDRVRQRLQQLEQLGSRQASSIEFELNLPSQHRRIVRDHSRYLKLGAEELVLGTTMDVTQEVLLRESLQGRLELLDIASELAHVGYWTETGDGEEWWSQFLQRLLQVEEGEPTNFSALQRRFHPRQQQEFLAESHQANARARKGETVTSLYRLQLPDQSECYIQEYLGSFVVEGKRRLIGVNQDVTEREQQKMQLAQELELQKIVNQSAKIGYSKWDLDTGLSWMDDFLLKLFEFRSQGWFDSADLQTRISSSSLKDLVKAQETVMAEGKAEVELRLKLPSGTNRILRTFQYKQVTDSKTFILGVTQDVTEEVELRNRLERQVLQMSTAAKVARVGFWSINRELTEFDEGMRSLLQMPPEEPANFESFAQRLHPDSAEEQRVRALEAVDLARRGEVAEDLFHFQLPDLSELFVLYCIKGVESEEGTQLFGVCHDVTELTRQKASLNQELELRKLTGAIGRIGSLKRDMEAGMTWMDEQLQEMFELDIPESGWFPSDDVFERVAPEFVKVLRKSRIDTMATGSSQIEIALKLPSETRRIVRLLQETRMENGKTLVLGCVQDVTEEVELRERLQDRLAQIQMVSRGARMGFWTDGEWDQEFRDMLMLDPEEPASQETFFKRLAPSSSAEQKRSSIEGIRKAWAGEFHTNLYHLQLPDQSELYLREYVGSYQIKGRQRLIGVNLDVTDFEQQRIQLAQELEVQKIANHAAKLGYFKRDVEADQTWFDDYYRDLLELPQEGWVDSDLFLERIDPDSLELLYKSRERTMKHGYSKAELKLNLPSSKLRYVRSIQKKITENGRSWILGVAQDVTEEVQLREQLQQQLQQIQMASKLARLGFWMEMEPENEDWSESYREMLQLAPDEPISLEALFKRLHPDSYEEQKQMLLEANEKALQGESTTIPLMLKLMDGSVKSILDHVGSIVVNERRLRLGVVQDISEQESLRFQIRQESTFRKLAWKNARIGYWMQILGEDSLWADSVLCELVQFGSESGRIPLKYIEGLVVDSDLPALGAARQEALDQGRSTVEIELQLPDGSQQFIRISREVIEWNDKVQIVGTTQDITDSVRTQELLRRSERLSAVGQLAAEITHDLKQPISILQLRLEMIEQLASSESPKIQQQVQTAFEALDYATEIIERPLKLVRESQAPKPWKLSKIVGQAMKILSTLLRHSQLSLIFENDWEHTPEQEPLVLAQETELTLVLQNLITNGKEAVEERRRTQQPLQEGESLRIELSSTHPNNVVLRVIDCGPGIPNELLQKIFAPMFTTKKGEQKGSGLGLSMCERIVHEYQGTIRAENRSDGAFGAVFHLEFPRFRQPSQTLGLKSDVAEKNP